MKLITTILATLAFASLATYAADEAKGGGAEKKKMDPAQAFAKKDANSDGKLSKEEFMKGQKDEAKAEKSFGARDKDGDGSISKEEFMAAPKKKKGA
ncbi:MAG TPA: EF-hand domain-containing protein [Prosthecobacter sp.]|nr:EF-hand domain-containing protein [Prosthecobacter sp.]